ncbi:MAG: hypothetical protein PHI90_06935, partial [Clostridia bacterium]|nr:hypothetical protein [Clostridia bacterium]
MSKVCLPIAEKQLGGTESKQVIDPEKCKELAEFYVKEGRFPSERYSINPSMNKEEFRELARVYLKFPEDLVKSAMEKSEKIVPDYFKVIFEQRSKESPTRAGSFFDASPEEIKKGLQDKKCIYTITGFNEKSGS